jgi:16S rRNA (uracil1498-N3)-methyltransferase
MRRFYLENIEETSLILEGDEFQHAAKVLRLRRGDEICVFDGKGFEKKVTIVDSKKRSLILESREKKVFSDRRPSHEVAVAVAFPKARGRSFLTEKLVECGVREIIPLISQRSLPSPDTQRLKREALAACKQSGINHLPKIHEAMPLEKVLLRENCVILDPKGERKLTFQFPLTFIVGPEGGWTAEESSLTVLRWNLGKQVFRTETASLVALARLT